MSKSRNIALMNFTISKLNKKSEISRDLSTRLPPDAYDWISQFTEHASKTRQVERFDILTSTSGADKDRNWRNNSNVLV